MRFQTLPKTSQEFGRANIHRGTLFQTEGAQTLKTLVPVLVMHLGAEYQVVACNVTDVVLLFSFFSKDSLFPIRPEGGRHMHA